MKVTRYITFFKKDYGEFAGEFRIDGLIKLDELKEIFNSYDWDDCLYAAYGIDIQQSQKLNLYLNFMFNFNDFNYELNCFQLEDAPL